MKGNGPTAGIRFPVEARCFSLPTALRPALGPTQLPIQWVVGTLSPGVKRSGVTLTNHFHLVQRSSYTSTPPYVFMAWFLINKTQGQPYLFTVFEKLTSEMYKLRVTNIYSSHRD
jgi:hypothetical protein